MVNSLKDKIVISNETRYLIIVREFISKIVREKRLSSDLENKIILAVDEAVTNIIEYAYGATSRGKIEIETEVNDERFTIFIRDYGKPFNPIDIPDFDVQEHVKMGKKKGLGIFLMRRVMDEVRYNYKNGIKNELILIKYIK